LGIQAAELEALIIFIMQKLGFQRDKHGILWGEAGVERCDVETTDGAAI